MAHQYSLAIRDAQANQIESTVGTSAKLYIRTGAAPANCAAADSGSLIATLDLPSDWLTAASSNGQVAKNGTWSGTASLAGTNDAGHFRIKDSGGTTCHIQGTITATGGGGDLTLDSISISQNQTVTVTSFTITRGNA